MCKFAILQRLISHCSAVHTLPLLHKLDPWVFTYRCVKDKRIFNVIVRIAKKHFHNIFLTFVVILPLAKVAGHIKICFLFSKNKIDKFMKKLKFINHHHLMWLSSTRTTWRIFLCKFINETKNYVLNDI